MQYFKNRIRAKSIPEHFEKEKLGTKNNIVREVNGKEADDIIKKMKQFLNDEYVYMCIENTETGEIVEREITDITFFRTVTQIESVKGQWSNIVSVKENITHIYIISFK